MDGVGMDILMLIGVMSYEQIIFVVIFKDQFMVHHHRGVEIKEVRELVQSMVVDRDVNLVDNWDTSSAEEQNFLKVCVSVEIK
jgi:hypothetical protein